MIELDSEFGLKPKPDCPMLAHILLTNWRRGASPTDSSFGAWRFVNPNGIDPIPKLVISVTSLRVSSRGIQGTWAC